MRALVAMSGGVDSSVAAAVMRGVGHEVIGVTMKMWQGPGGEAPTAGCCTVSDAEDARRVAAQLDIPYYVLDYTEEFMGGVVEHFVADYIGGRTPNPCVECNRTVKFTRLVRHAEDLDCSVVVTGHYARTEHDGTRWRLRRGVDPAKDQSYVLSMLGQSQLGKIRFPVGTMTKAETREVARELGLRTAAKKESQDICFVGDRDYRSFLADRDVTDRAGPIIDHDGTVLGDHGGITNFTIGQRRGLGVAVGEPRFVTAVDAQTATVTVGPRHQLAVGELDIERLSWVDQPRPGPLAVQYRAHGAAADADLAVTDHGAVVRFRDPQEAVAAGQTVAFYDGDEVLGGGIIAATR